jgi:hypothetical protein
MIKIYRGLYSLPASPGALLTPRRIRRKAAWQELRPAPLSGVLLRYPSVVLPVLRSGLQLVGV